MKNKPNQGISKGCIYSVTNTSGNGIMLFFRKQQYTKYIKDPYIQKSQNYEQ